MPFGQMCQVDDICDEPYKYKLKYQYGIMCTLWTSFILILFLFLENIEAGQLENKLWLQGASGNFVSDIDHKTFHLYWP